MANQNKTAITGLILSIVAFCFCWIPILGIILAIVALVFDIKSLKCINMGMAIGGIICSAIAIILNLIVSFVVLFYLASWPVIKEEIFEDSCESHGYYNENTKCCTYYDGEISCLED